LHGLAVLYPNLERLYIDLHQNPGLSVREEDSAENRFSASNTSFEVTEGVWEFGPCSLNDL
jgi:hypothetical protein